MTFLLYIIHRHPHQTNCQRKAENHFQPIQNRPIWVLRSDDTLQHQQQKMLKEKKVPDEYQPNQV